MGTLHHLETNREIGAWPGEIPVNNLYTAGPAAEAFFRALKDQGKLLASRCPTCKNAVLPARMFCERCFAATPETVEVSPASGTLVTWTTAHVDKDGRAVVPPVTVGFVRFERAEGGLFGRILGDVGKLRAGAAVEMVLRKKGERKGHAGDIEGFKAR